MPLKAFDWLLIEPLGLLALGLCELLFLFLFYFISFSDQECQEGLQEEVGAAAVPEWDLKGHQCPARHPPGTSPNRGVLGRNL